MFSGNSKQAISAKKETKSSAFKTLISELLSKNGDFSKIRDAIKSSKIKCWVKETYPKFLISDGSFFISGYLTQDSYNKCHQGKDVNISITDLQDGLILITKWTAELTRTNSAEDFTSYGGIEMRLIIHEFKIKQEEQMKMSKYPTNLYRDDEVKSLVQHYIKEQKQTHLQKAIANDDKNLGPQVVLENEMDIIKVKKENDHKTIREINTISLNHKRDPKLTADDEVFTDFKFESQPKTQVLTMQEIFSLEKGQEALRALNVNLSVQKRREEPNMEKHLPKPVRDADEDEEVVQSAGLKPAKIKKSLEVKKSKEDASKSKIKVTTTLVKEEPKSKPASKKKKVAKSGKVSKSKQAPLAAARSTRSKSAVQSGKNSKKRVNKQQSKSKRKDQKNQIKTAGDLRKLIEKEEQSSKVKKEKVEEVRVQPKRTAKSAQPSAPQTPSKKPRK